MARPAIGYRFAGPDDDDALRGLLRDNPMAGDVQLTLEREPSVFLAATVEGDTHELGVAFEQQSGRAIGMGSRAIRDAFVNGEVTRLGYLSQLRVTREHRGRKKLLVDGYRFLEEHHRATGGPPLYLTTIVTDNSPARRILEAGLRGMPTYVPMGELVTLAISVLGSRGTPPEEAPVRQARDEDLEDVAGLLQEANRAYQLAPAWTAADLRSEERTRGLAAGDFYLLGEGAPRACLARWDQLSFKQAVVRGYSRRLHWVRPFLNCFHRLLGQPWLPPVGSALRNLYISHLAGDPEDLCHLLLHAYEDAVEAGYSLITLGFCRGHPALEPVQRLFPSHREYSSQVYVVHWEDGREAARALDGRPPSLEVAVL